ncbi:MAG: c-type cytochrome, partial [Planctomycetes bacterium]|nr:c-type cytochrome [Planctomycetota bacterium]
DGKLYRVTPPPLGGDPKDTRVERVPLDLGHAHGLLWAFDALYVVVGESTPRAPGLYRLRDTDGDDELDQVDLLRELGGSGEHGPHAVVLGPDGESLWIVAGNFTKVPELAASRVPATWGEDELLPHLDDPNGHDPHIKAPGGWICRTDRDGKEFELFAVGLRNCYDAAFGPEGELFTYDSDMEWDIGAPWYRPTRVLHVVSGADYGWRNGSAKWNADWPDTLPSVIDLGAGSPTGVLYGKELRFPEKYERALFCADWAYGQIHCVHLSPRGSSFSGTSEVFARGKPFPVTDLVTGKEGALYVTTGGRRAQSGLYRITWTGDPTATSGADGREELARKATAGAGRTRDRRRRLEEAHCVAQVVGTDGVGARSADDGESEKAALTALACLASDDPFLRCAARIVLERQDLLDESQPEMATLRELDAARAAAATAIARIHTGGPKWREDLLLRLEGVNWTRADVDVRIDWLRVLQLVLVRCAPIDPVARERLAARLVSALEDSPSDSAHDTDDTPTMSTLDPRTNMRRELVRVIAGLDVEAGLEPVLYELERASTQEDAIHAAHALLAQKVGWDVERRKRALLAIDAWRAKAKGGHSLVKFVDAIRERMVKALSDDERAALGALAEAPKTADDAPAPAATPLVHAWTRAELEALFREVAHVPSGANTGSNPASSSSTVASVSSAPPDALALGRTAYTKARCATCHRIEGAGGATGPDLTGVGRRYGRGDLLESLLEPSKVISDQFRDVELVTTDGELHVGRIEREDARTITLRRLPPNEDLIELAKAELEERRPTALSRMPSNLLDVLSADEVKALVAYLLER